MKKIVIITGLTASGKSGLAVEIAKKFNGEIISCDSVQVYKGLDIGSAKVTKKEQQEVKHHLIDIKNPTEEYNVGNFVEDCKNAIFDILNRNKLPIIVGGTAMYVKALIEGYTLGSVKNEEYRKTLEKLAISQGKIKVWEMLNEIDPQLASTVHCNNLNRVIRYLEMKKFGEPKKEKSILEDFLVCSVGITGEREFIYSKINQRVDQMIKEGLIEEVKGLLNRGIDLKYNSMNTIGYKEICDYINNITSLERAVELIKQHTRNYAKRQLTFLKTIKGLEILNIEQAREKIIKFLNN